jgi:hypothetical protein
MTRQALLSMRLPENISLHYKGLAVTIHGNQYLNSVEIGELRDL